MDIKNKKILITAGPTWVPIDSVRVISNIATGETGMLLAENLQRLGAKITLLLGPIGAWRLNKKIKVVNFKFFEELKDKLIQELRNKKYDVVIHSAAVSDYQPKKKYPHKLSSGIKNLRLDLVPTMKIINLIKKISPHAFLVGFKFAPGAAKSWLIKEAVLISGRYGLDLVVANSQHARGYTAYISNPFAIRGPFRSKEAMVNKLLKLLASKI